MAHLRELGTTAYTSTRDCSSSESTVFPESAPNEAEAIFKMCFVEAFSVSPVSFLDKGHTVANLQKD